VNPRASQETIEAVWRSLLKRRHPDTAADPRTATEAAKRLNVAHDWLADPRLRKLYDAQAGMGRRRPSAPPRRRTPETPAEAPPAPAPPAFVTNWTLPRLLWRCQTLSPAEIRALVAAAERQPPAWRRAGHAAVERAERAYIAAAGSRAEAEAREAHFTWSGPVAAWPAWTLTERAANAGAAWELSKRAASIVHDAAVALYWGSGRTPAEAAGYFLPWHEAIGLDPTPDSPQRVTRPIVGWQGPPPCHPSPLFGDLVRTIAAAIRLGHHR
jgi:hypothetical protein